MTQIVLSDEARVTAGVLLLSVVAVEFGGLYMLRIVRRQVAATGFQISFSRAGHAVYAGAVSLAIGAVTLGIGVLTGP